MTKPRPCLAHFRVSIFPSLPFRFATRFRARAKTSASLRRPNPASGCPPSSSSSDRSIDRSLLLLSAAPSRSRRL
ncbi:hypothetical protein NL676_006039 [Syzygium grande]|nr:hypothetical protein NL676_006039 [Syzygium grande]